jgi:hypothetical protein
MVKAVYSRFFNTMNHVFADHEEAKEFLDSLEDDGEGYAIGIHDEETNVFYVKENMEIWGRQREDVVTQKLENLKQIEINPIKIEFYE